MTFYQYEVIDTETEDQIGLYETLADAQRVARKFDRYEIWLNHFHNGNWEPTKRVEFCDPYDGDDDRIRQACGEAPWEPPS